VIPALVYAVLLLLGAETAAAAPIWVAGGDDVATVCKAACTNAGATCAADGDCSGCTTGCTARDTFLAIEGLGGGANTDDLALTGGASSPWPHVHRANNGGSDSSYWAYDVNPESGETAYLRPALSATLVNDLTVGMSINVPSPPSGARIILELREDDGVGGTQQGAYVELNTDRTVSVRYRGGTLVGSSTEKFQDGTCADDTNGTNANFRQECNTSGTPAVCTSPQVCACSATTGAGCYWSGIELRESVTSGTVVTIDLWIDGRLTVASGALTVTGAQQLKPEQTRFGAAGTEARALQIYLDDLVIDPSTRAGYGYVLTAHPTTDASSSSVLQWSKDACGAGAHIVCVNDWASGGVYDEGSGGGSGSDRLTTGAGTNKREQFADSTTVSVRSDETITAVAYVLAGATSANTGTREVAGHIRNSCLSGTCVDIGVADVVFTLAQNQLPYLWTEGVFPQAPAAFGIGKWTNTNVAHLGVALRTTTNNTQNSRLAALLYYIRAQKSDEPIGITGGDHNKGTDDGLVSIYTIGDSTNGDTLSSACPASSTNAGIGCTQHDYCSWDNVTKDKPTGGCAGVDDACRTCTGRRSQTASLAGYACDATSGGSYNCACPSGNCTGQCSASFCLNNANAPCVQDADCALGTCDTTATCVESCPGADCPTRAAWGSHLVGRIGADVIARCPAGGETTSQLAANRWSAILDGKHRSCRIEAVGPGITTQCSCATDYDCGLCDNYTALGCSSDAGCFGGHCTTGTCSSGVCTTGAGQRIACKDASTDCALYQYCTMPPPDTLVVLEGYNDDAMSLVAPTCGGTNGAVASSPGGPCDYCPDTLCLTNSDCAAISADSVCAGHEVDRGTAYGCSTDLARDGVVHPCSSWQPACASNLFCPSNQPCSESNLADYLSLGTCTCTVLCPDDALFACRSSACRRKCGRCSNDSTRVCGADINCGGGTCQSTDSDCGPGGDCASDAPFVCKGRCTCPSNARTCSTNADCTTPTVNGIAGAGYCSGGHCACTGISTHRCDATCPASYREYYRAVPHNHMAQVYHSMEAVVSALAETDGRPRLVVSTVPWSNTGFGLCSYAVEGFSGDPLGYQVKGNVHLRSEFPFLIDSAKALSIYPLDVVHTDVHHFNALGGFLIGGVAVAQGLKTFGTCVTADPRLGLPIPQNYCRNGDNSQTSTVCTSSAECTASQSCQPRPCTCVCRTTAECRNWYGTGHTCVSGICKKSGTDSCTSIFGAGYACDTASAHCLNGATDACPASGDSCNGTP
jgi:hypothetical protein